MPTTPPAYLLDRDLSRAALQKHIEVADPLLTEVVNYGVAALRRCMDALKDDGHNLGVLLPLRHLLEMVDGVHVQLVAGAPSPARLLLRSAFEALVSIEYMLKADTERRAYAYLAGWAQREVAKCRGLKKYATLVEKAEELDERIATLERQLGHPGWKEASDALRALKRQRVKPEWYKLDGGPANLADLAQRVGFLAEYDVLYRDWSGPTHASDLSRQIITGRGTVALRRLRDPEMFNKVISFAVNFAVKGTRAVLLHYRPEEERAWAAWYVREVRDAYLRF